MNDTERLCDREDYGYFEMNNMNNMNYCILISFLSALSLVPPPMPCIEKVDSNLADYSEDEK